MSAEGLVVVDKPGGMTSHDVVARVRRLGRTRRVGHGGTLDPMATGVLVVAVGRATRLLTYISGADKTYQATIRLGGATVTDDAEGEFLSTADASGIEDAAVLAGLAALTGEIDQVPSSVSAVKVAGKRAYQRVREGEEVALAARRVTVREMTAHTIRRTGPWLDVEATVTCSTGTYIRAIARDLGAGLGVGGHLTALRRTAVGGFTLAEAVTLDDLAAREPEVVNLSLAQAADRFFTRRDATAEQARVLAHGAPLEPVGLPGPYAVFAPQGELLAVVSERAGRARPEVVFTG